MNKKFLTVLSLISACMSRGIFAPILRKIIRTFFSDKTTNQIVVLISYIGGIIRIITALFGLVLFYIMSKAKLIDYLKAATGITLGVAAHHYGGKLLNKPEDNAEALAQKYRDERLERIDENVQILVDNGKKIPEGATISEENRASLDENIQGIIDAKSDILFNPDSNKEIQGSIIDECINKIKEIIDIIDKGNRNKFISDFSLDDFYKFLDSLTLLEESAFLHILTFVFILLTVFSIISTLFSNELISYFNLETKYPRLGVFFRLIAKYQRYYLIWNFLTLIFICIMGIVINLLVFY